MREKKQREKKAYLGFFNAIANVTNAVEIRFRKRGVVVNEECRTLKGSEGVEGQGRRAMGTMV